MCDHSCTVCVRCFTAVQNIHWKERGHRAVALFSEGPFSNCRTGHMHGSCVSTSVYVCGQERELLILPAPGAPDRNMDKQLMDSRLPVDKEAEESIDFKFHKREFPITTNVRATNCW